MRYELAARTAALLEQYLTYRPDWLAAWLAGKPAGISEPRRRAHGGRALAGRAVAAHRRRARHRQPPSVGGLLRRDEGDGARRPGARGAAGRGARLLPADHAAALPRHPAPPRAVDRPHGSTCSTPAANTGSRSSTARRLSCARRAGPRRPSRSRQPPAGRVGQADAGAHRPPARRTTARRWSTTPASRRARAATLLAQLQNAMLDLTDLARGSVDARRRRPQHRGPRLPLARRASSRCCRTSCSRSSPAPHPPRPSDILVVTPDLEAAAPLIDAVFGNVPKARAIPVRDHRPAGERAQSLRAGAAVACSPSPTSRFQASAVFELLQQPIIARRFGIGDAELEAIHAWIGAMPASAGASTAAIAPSSACPRVGRHSFSDGLDRLFLGYALPAVRDGAGERAPCRPAIRKAPPRWRSAASANSSASSSACTPTLAQAEDAGRSGGRRCSA